MGGGGFWGDLEHSLSNIYMTPSFLGVGDGTIVTAVVGFGGVGIVKIKIVPRREPLRRSQHAPARIVPTLELQHDFQRERFHSQHNYGC